MTDPLTKEERKIVDRVRHRIREDEAWGDCDTDASELLAIIDNLSKRGVKKYSEDELRAGFEASCISDKAFSIKADIGNYALPHIQNRWLGFLGGARFLGTLEEK